MALTLCSVPDGDELRFMIGDNNNSGNWNVTLTLTLSRHELITAITNIYQRW